MRIRKLDQQEKSRKPVTTAKSPMAIPGMRWTGTTALAPANLLQLQQSAGNKAVVELLKQHADPGTDSLVSLKVYQAARRDGTEPLRGVDAKSAQMAMQQDPHLGDWQFRFVTSADGGGVLYWVTLSNYKNRQRDILIDATSHTPLEVTGKDLDARDRKHLTEWAMQMLTEQLSGERPSIQQKVEAASSQQEEDESLLESLLAGIGGADEDNPGAGLGLGALAAMGAAASKKGGAKGKPGSSAGKKK